MAKATEAPSQPTRILRIGEVKARTGLSRTAVYDDPALKKVRVQLGPRTTGWVESGVDAYIAELIANSCADPQTTALPKTRAAVGSKKAPAKKPAAKRAVPKKPAAKPRRSATSKTTRSPRAA